MSELMNNFQDQIKKSSRGFGFLVIRMLIGGFVGVTVALVLQTLTGMGMLSFWFVTLSIGAAISRMTQKWSVWALLILLLVWVLLINLVRLYIMVAPG